MVLLTFGYRLNTHANAPVEFCILYFFSDRVCSLANHLIEPDLCDCSPRQSEIFNLFYVLVNLLHVFFFV